MLTRSAARDLLTNRVTIHSDKLPEDVLLEIFDAYRRLYKLEPNYENVWNSRQGWFKLAHVCRSWRRVVLLSPSRLHVHLLFTPRRSSREPLLRSLPRFPILVDYRYASWTEKEENLALAALRHRDRVRTIALRFPDKDTPVAKIFRALSHPFPELESLEIYHGPIFDFIYNSFEGELIVPATLLSNFAPCLRRLTLQRVVPSCFYPLLSSTTGLVELALTLETLPPDASLLLNLQRMSRLRRLQLDLRYFPTTPADGTVYSVDDVLPPTYAGDVVPLLELTHIDFMGHRLFLEELVVGLAAPSLQHLNAGLQCWSPRDSFPIPHHLCKFICDTEYQFTAARLEFSNSKLTFNMGAAGANSQSIEPFRIILREPVSLEKMGRALSGPLSTVEVLTITWSVDPWRTEGRFQTEQWRRFCYHVPRAKVVRVPGVELLALEVAHSFQQGGQEPEFLPALQRVEVDLWVGENDQYVSICDAFESFIAARKREGRPIYLLFLWRHIELSRPESDNPPPTVYSGRL